MATKRNVPAEKAQAAQTFPTPEELRAFFFLLRDLGWKPGAANPPRPTANTPPKTGTSLPTHAQMDALFALAGEMGLMSLNTDEKALIENLRLTTYTGRNHVYETAAAMRRHRPWVFGGDMAHNTEE